MKTKQNKQTNTESRVMTVSHKIGSAHISKIGFPEKWWAITLCI